MIKKEDYLTLSKMINQKVRSFILRYIRMGVEDDYSTNNNLNRRHAFTVKEMFEAYQVQCEKSEDQINLTTMHFHIKKLEKLNMIFPVTSIVLGNHRMKYYGRTCKMYGFKNVDNALDAELKKFAFPLAKIAESINPQISGEEIISMFKASFHRQNKLTEEVLLKWVEDNYDLIYKHKIDILDISEYLSRLLILDKSEIEPLKILIKNIRLGLNINY